MQTLSDAPLTFSERALGPATQGLRRWRSWSERHVLPTRPEPLPFHSPNEVVLEHRSMQLRRFVRDGGAPPVPHPLGHPLLLVAPEVNGSALTDYGPEQSLVQAALLAGAPAVYVVHWRSATEATADATILDSVQAIEAALDAIGERPHLAGICQGGWESTLVVARAPERVRSLTVIAAPIDFHAGGVLPALVGATPQWVYEGLVAMGGGVMRHEHLNQGFDLLKAWERKVLNPLRDWNQGEDPEHRAREDRLRRWYRGRKDLPGPMYLAAVDQLFRKNQLVQGTFRLAPQLEPVDLSVITCPLALVTGTRDHITPAAQTLALAEHARSTRVRHWAWDAGHVGVSIGKKPLEEGWPEVFSWLAQGEQAAAGGEA